MNKLDILVNAYRNAPDEFKATRYWAKYLEESIDEIKKTDINELRSGKYPVYGTFGFTETYYTYHHNMPWYRKVLFKLVRKLFITNRTTMPYSIRLSDIREMAYRHCNLLGTISEAKPISDVEICDFGNPNDLFTIDQKKYTMMFFRVYIRYCFVQKLIKLKGDETIVELGSGSGHQVELLKKMYPNLTIICFDMPSPLYLCGEYLTRALGDDMVVTGEKNLDVTDLSKLEKGKVHLLGNWLFPLLKEFEYDIFWNAASFGEMEPEVVDNYLSYVKGGAKWVYLLNARYGKESSENKGVKTPTTFEDYNKMLDGYSLVEEQDSYLPHRRWTQSGGYFEAIWKKG